MINCLIVDDEREAHYVLKNYISRHSALHLAAQCYTAAEAIDWLNENAVDLIFLDINMPEKDGFSLIADLVKPPLIILTTAYSDFALKAFDYGVLDYLVKPIPYERFEQAVALCTEVFVGRPKVSHKIDESISLKVDHDMIEFRLNEIIYIQSYGNYIKIYTEEKVYLCSATTSELEKKLPPSLFTRIHKSYIVSLNHIGIYQNEMVSMQILNVLLPVGITYRRSLNEVLNP
ncbi:LytTR family DNA-binding domain-containing protein [Pedobacter aquatilis]|uniref:LytR/AlgR family response regulator transcription factor n=1 Tax=Pedobacter aquatilis TaxID=351343 RepID=UPI00292FD264|nr:LytTR family DNA-binding domain-containing protein [Pedobacter aquatilis]